MSSTSTESVETPRVRVIGFAAKDSAGRPGGNGNAALCGSPACVTASPLTQTLRRDGKAGAQASGRSRHGAAAGGAGAPGSELPAAALESGREADEAQSTHSCSLPVCIPRHSRRRVPARVAWGALSWAAGTCECGGLTPGRGQTRN